MIGEGLAASIDTVESVWSDEGRTDSAVILLSDGLDTKKDPLDPLAVATRARSLGLPVYTVVLGQTGSPGGANVDLMSQIRRDHRRIRVDGCGLTGVHQTLGSQLSTELKIGSKARLFVPVAVVLAMAAAVLVLVSYSRPKFEPPGHG